MKYYCSKFCIIIILYLSYNQSFAKNDFSLKYDDLSDPNTLSLNGWDFLQKRIIDKFNDSSFYQGEITITNYGYFEHDIDSLFIQDNKDSVFILENKKIPKTIKPHEAISLNVFFKPRFEGEYVSTISLSYDNSTKVSVQYLRGTGCQPHIKIDSLIFSNAVLIGNSKTAFTNVFNVVNNIKASMDLTLFNIKIVGFDSSSYNIDSTFFIKNQFPIIIQPDEYLKVPIIFSPTHIGLNEATLMVESDAPEQTNASLTGIGITPDNVIDNQSVLIKILNVNPTPFNSKISINWFNPYNQIIAIKICDIMGNTFFEKSEYLPHGNQIFTWQPKPKIQSGLYYFIFSNNRETVRLKAMYIK